MAARSYDIITVDGGIAASKDRVRGEALVSWGVADANELGISRLLKEKCAHEVPHVEAGSGLRNLTATTRQQLPLRLPVKRKQTRLL